MTTDFAPNITRLRKLKGFTQEVVANALEVKRTTLSGWENAASEPSLSQLVAIGQYYRVGLDLLLTSPLYNMANSQLEALIRAY